MQPPIAPAKPGPPTARAWLEALSAPFCTRTSACVLSGFPALFRFSNHVVDGALVTKQPAGVAHFLNQLPASGISGSLLVKLLIFRQCRPLTVNRSGGGNTTTRVAAEIPHRKASRVYADLLTTAPTVTIAEEGDDMVLSILMTVLGVVFLAAGFVGCVVPAIPGPILAFISLILISIPGGWAIFQWWLLVIVGALTLFATVIDNILPAWASKKSGAGKPGVWGSVAGMIVGSFFIPPFGTIIGAFAGALLGEMLFNRENKKPLKAALGVFRGTLFGILVKLTATGVTTFFFIRGAVKLFGEA